MVVLDGDEGTVLLRESILSFSAPAQVSAVFIADTSYPRRDLTDLLPAGKPIRVISIPHARKDTAFEKLQQVAFKEEFTFGLLAQSNEILKQQADSQAVEALPHGWQDVDIYQVVTNIRHRRNADILIRLCKFAIVGPVEPCPIPKYTGMSINAQAWQGVSVDANVYNIPQSKAVATYLHTKERLLIGGDSLTMHVLQHQLIIGAMQAQLYAEAYDLINKRLEAGSCGWAEIDGQLWVMSLQAECAAELKLPLDKVLFNLMKFADLSLSHGRMEGLLALHVALSRNQMFALTSLSLASMAGMPPEHRVCSWMGDPATYTSRLRENLGVGMFYASDGAGKTLAADQLFTAASHPIARLHTKIQENYKCVARHKDFSPCASWFPRPSDLLLPATIVHREFVSPDKTAAFVEYATTCAEPINWHWLRLLLSNAVRAHAEMTWGGLIAFGDLRADFSQGAVLCTPTNTPFIFGEQACVGSSGYVCILPLADCAGARILTDDGDTVFALTPGNLYCIRAGASWRLVPGAGSPTILVSQLTFSTII